MTKRRFDKRTKASALRMYHAGVSFAKITESTGVSHHTVNRWRRDMGLEARPPARTGYDESVRAEAVEMYKIHSSDFVAEHLGVSRAAVTYWARRACVVPGIRERHYHAMERRERAVVMYRDGVPMQNIEAALGCERQTIRNWAREAGVPARAGNNLKNRTRA